MSLMNENGGGLSAFMPVIPGGMGYGGGGYGMDGFGGGGWFWFMIIFVIAMFSGNWGGFGYGGNGGAVNTVNNDLQRGFDQQAVMGGLNGITSGINGLSQQMCSGNAGIVAAINNGFSQAEIAANARQMADMNQNFAMQSSLQQCCCDNRAGLADLKYTIATEACADRSAVTAALQEVTAQNNANTQRILDQMCQDRYDNLKAKYDDIQRQLTVAQFAASENAQTAKILSDNAAQTAALEQYLNPAPIPAYVVQNPNGCNCNYGCGNRFVA